MHLVWAFQGRSRLGGAIHWTWIEAYGAHEPIPPQEAEKESHGAATAWPKPSISRFLGYSGPDGACKWVIWGWESGSGSCALHSRSHLMLRVLNLDMSVVMRTTFCSVVFGCLSNQCARCSLTNRKYTRDAHRACTFRETGFENQFLKLVLGGSFQNRLKTGFQKPKAQFHLQFYLRFWFSSCKNRRTIPSSWWFSPVFTQPQDWVKTGKNQFSNQRA